MLDTLLFFIVLMVIGILIDVVVIAYVVNGVLDSRQIEKEKKIFKDFDYM